VEPPPRKGDPLAARRERDARHRPSQAEPVIRAAVAPNRERRLPGTGREQRPTVPRRRVRRGRRARGGSGGPEVPTQARPALGSADQEQGDDREQTRDATTSSHGGPVTTF